MFYDCSSLPAFDYDLTYLIDGTAMFSRCYALTTFNSDLQSLPTGSNMFSGCSSLTTFDADLTSLTNGYYMFENCSELATFNSYLPSLSNGNYMFSYCQLDKESALRVLNSIPIHANGLHYLTIGIHVDYKNDEEIAAAITSAESKKWMLMVQWNGTAGTSGASAYGLRHEDHVYAKLDEQLEDGTVSLSWGHYVTDPSGYMEFSNLEEAKNYFGVNE